MTKLRLIDRTRRPPEWTGHLSATQVAVFLRDIKTEVELDPEGNAVGSKTPPCCFVFDSMEEAEVFCRQKVEKIERMKCEIYDRRGKIYPLRTFTHAKHAHRLPNSASARRMIVIAWLLLAISPLLFWIDFRREGTLVVPTVVGFACIMTAGRLLYWGHSELARMQENQANL